LIRGTPVAYLNSGHQPEEIMAADYEDAINLDQMGDDDVRDLVLQRLEELDEFDADDIEVEVADGRVRVEGRVGTEGERQVVEQVMTGLGVVDYDNNVVVDRNVRASRAEAADIARLEDAAVDGPLGDPSSRSSETAQHFQDDTGSEIHGTRDMQKAIEEGQSYTPPQGPMQEGVGDGERH
jgi:hypothetical protein